MAKKQKLELTWIGKDVRPKLEPRILIEDVSISYHAQARYSDNDIYDNLLIHGDNLLALKALEQDYAGKVKCIYIDPPYNTGSAFEHYDDGLEHSIWLGMMRDRLEILRNLLSDDGSLWVNLDDNEGHYFKVMADELFGRACFITSVIWEKADSPRNSARQFSEDHDYIFIYSKNPNWQPTRLPRTEASDSIYSNPDNDPHGPWLPGDPYANKPYSKGKYTITGPTGRTFSPPPGRFWRIAEEKLWELDSEGKVWWGPNKDARPSLKRYLSEVADLVPRTLWKKDDVGSNRTSKNEMRLLFPGESSFTTPKPERLIQRILHIATNPGDLVLDSFLGSGTTAAVAHKMGRRWIGIELGEHCYTHCMPRLQKVIDGQDPGGITKAVNWQGGGGFRFYELAPSLLSKDSHDRWVISEKYNANMLAAAMCKLMGFHYNPSPDIYWQHGQSTETDFIYVTTQTLEAGTLALLSKEVGPKQSLLICCKAFKGNENDFPNITLVKIPKAVLNKCEWGKDDYSLNIQNLPMAAPAEEENVKPTKKTKGKQTSLSLFTEEKP